MMPRRLQRLQRPTLKRAIAVQGSIFEINALLFYGNQVPIHISVQAAVKYHQESGTGVMLY